MCTFFLQLWVFIIVQSKEQLVTQSGQTLCDSMDCRLPGLPSPCYCPGKNIGVSCHSLLQGIFPTQGLNLHLLHYRQILYRATGKHFKLWNSTLIAWKDRVGSYRGEDTAAAAKSLQSCPTLCDPIDGSPPGSTIPGILQARTLEWVVISFSNAWKWKVKGKSLSRDPMDCSSPASSVHEILQARILEWVAITLRKPKLKETHVSHCLLNHYLQ